MQKKTSASKRSFKGQGHILTAQYNCMLLHVLLYQHEPKSSKNIKIIAFLLQNWPQRQPLKKSRVER